MATTAENLHIQLLTKALFDTGNADKVEEINQKMIEFISKGKLPTDEKQ